MSTISRALYWLLTGALLGFGYVAILSIGFPFILLGIILAIFGAALLGGRGLWAALIGFGGLPASILLWDVTSAPWACQPDGGFTPLPNVHYYTCVDTFAGQLTSYHVLAFFLAIIALLGIVWPLLYHLWSRRRAYGPVGQV